MTQKVTVTPLADITDLITGTSAPWYWEVEACYENGDSIAFTWNDGIVTIPGYGGGRVLVSFTLYLLYDAVSQYFPKDPTNPASPLVYWENRLRSFFTVSSTIKSFEKGLTDVTGGNIGVTLDDNWIMLAKVPLVFSNSVLRVYTNDAISFKGITNQKSYADYVLNLSVQKRQTILEGECHWGDPAYLNRIDRTVSTAFYNGAAIPEKYQGMAIPMLFGPETPYRVTQSVEFDIGLPLGFSEIESNTKDAGTIVSYDDLIVKIIPTSSTTGIIGRMPNYQSITSAPINEALINTDHIFERSVQAQNPIILNTMLLGQICGLGRAGAPAAARYFKKTSYAYFLLGIPDLVADIPHFPFETIQDTNQRTHFFSEAIPLTSWTDPAILSNGPASPPGPGTPGGNRWITCSVTGLDLLTNDVYVVLRGITGARSGIDVLKFALEKHGYTVDAPSFASLASEFPATTIQRVGIGETIPTLGGFISEINQPLMTVLVFPASNDIPFMIKINPKATPVGILKEKQIADLQVQDNYTQIAKNVRFLPKYAQSDAFINSLTVDVPALLASQFNADRTETILHPFSSGQARYYDVAQVYGSPSTLVTFTLLDDEADIEVGDMIQIEHSEFEQKIIIVSIATRPIGRTLQGRYLYVVNN